jgi:hypothetical protein
MKIPDPNWVAWGIGVGTFWGLLSDVINRPPGEWRTPRKFVRSFFIFVFQFVFQFMGGFAGVIGIGLFFDRYANGYFGALELILLGVSLVGISGKLSDIIYRLPGFMTDLARFLATLAKKKAEKGQEE